jgi:V8-like Glu-specific endopeptidase
LRLIFYITILLFFLINSASANIVKWTDCKIIESPFTYKIMKGLYKNVNEELLYGDFLKEENDNIEYSEVTFDINNKKFTRRQKNIDKDLVEDKDDFEFINENVVKILGKPWEMKFPIPRTIKSGDKEIKLSDETKFFAVKVYTYNFEENTIIEHLYFNKEKELVRSLKCESDLNIANGNTYSSGTAFFINKNGYLLTNNHVVKGCTLSKISYKNKDYDTKLIATDKTLDLALLKAEVKPKTFLNFSNDEAKKLNKVYVAGYPLGKGLSDDLKISSGIVSSIKGFEDNSNEIQIDAPINPGNSGGPIINENGELIAIAVAGMTEAQNINFGIKSSAAERFLKSNNINLSKSMYSRVKDNDKLLEILEEGTVYTYCN